jgi:recombinational DNA repair protein RecR
VSDERARRVGHNEALFRQVNERIEDLNEAFAHASQTFSVVCECADLSCTEHIDVPPAVYERTRQDSARFLVKPGHEAPDVEHVAEADGTYVVVEKGAPAARRVAEETDPRS